MARGIRQTRGGERVAVRGGGWGGARGAGRGGGRRRRRGVHVAARDAVWRRTSRGDGRFAPSLLRCRSRHVARGRRRRRRGGFRRHRARAHREHGRDHLGGVSSVLRWEKRRGRGRRPVHRARRGYQQSSTSRVRSDDDGVYRRAGGTLRRDSLPRRGDGSGWGVARVDGFARSHRQTVGHDPRGGGGGVRAGDRRGRRDVRGRAVPGGGRGPRGCGGGCVALAARVPAGALRRRR